MIPEVLRVLHARLDAHVTTRLGMAGTSTQLGAPAFIDGALLPQQINQLALFITRIAPERMPETGAVGRSPQGLREAREIIRQEVDLVVASLFEPDAYADGLVALDAAMDFVRLFPDVNRLQFPDLPSKFLRGGVEILSLSYEELAQIWSMHGGTYRPSFAMRLRFAAEPSEA